LADAPRSGRPDTFTAEQLCNLIAIACEKPEHYGRPITHWTARELKDEAIRQAIVPSISVRQVNRLLRATDLQPHRSRYWLNAKPDPQKDQKNWHRVCPLSASPSRRRSGRTDLLSG
jgi:putative transposase